MENALTVNNTKTFTQEQIQLYSLIKELEEKNGNSIALSDYLDIIVRAGKVLESQEWTAVTKAVSQAMVDAHMTSK